MSEEKKPCASCTSESCSQAGRRPDESEEQYLERLELCERMSRIRRKIIVLSGKGGVGKSTVAVNLAVALSLRGKSVGLLDVDIHGPSVPKLLNLDAHPEVVEGMILPVECGNLKVMSIGFLLRDRNDAVIWRGPMKMGVIKQFLKDVEWGELDYLVVDCPPGTGDEPLSVVQLMGEAKAVIVTTPQDVALLDVRKSITFCRQLHVPVLGVIENMSGFVCPECGKVTDIFKTGGGERMASEMGVPFLGRVPIDPQVVSSGDTGRPFMYSSPDSATGKVFDNVAQILLAQ